MNFLKKIAFFFLGLTFLPPHSFAMYQGFLIVITQRYLDKTNRIEPNFFELGSGACAGYAMQYILDPVLSVRATNCLIESTVRGLTQEEDACVMKFVKKVAELQTLEKLNCLHQYTESGFKNYEKPEDFLSTLPGQYLKQQGMEFTAIHNIPWKDIKTYITSPTAKKTHTTKSSNLLRTTLETLKPSRNNTTPNKKVQKKILEILKTLESALLPQNQADPQTEKKMLIFFKTPCNAPGHATSLSLLPGNTVFYDPNFLPLVTKNPLPSIMEGLFNYFCETLPYFSPKTFNENEGAISIQIFKDTASETRPHRSFALTSDHIKDCIQYDTLASELMDVADAQQQGQVLGKIYKISQKECIVQKMLEGKEEYYRISINDIAHFFKESQELVISPSQDAASQQYIHNLFKGLPYITGRHFEKGISFGSRDRLASYFENNTVSPLDMRTKYEDVQSFLTDFLQLNIEKTRSLFPDKATDIHNTITKDSHEETDAFIAEEYVFIYEMIQEYLKGKENIPTITGKWDMNLQILAFHMANTLSETMKKATFFDDWYYDPKIHQHTDVSLFLKKCRKNLEKDIHSVLTPFLTHACEMKNVLIQNLTPPQVEQCFSRMVNLRPFENRTVDERNAP